MGGAGVEGERERKTFTGSLKRNHIQRGEAIKVCVCGGGFPGTSVYEEQNSQQFAHLIMASEKNEKTNIRLIRSTVAR